MTSDQLIAKVIDFDRDMANYINGFDRIDRTITDEVIRNLLTSLHSSTDDYTRQLNLRYSPARRAIFEEAGLDPDTYYVTDPRTQTPLQKLLAPLLDDAWQIDIAMIDRDPETVEEATTLLASRLWGLENARTGGVPAEIEHWTHLVYDALWRVGRFLAERIVTQTVKRKAARKHRKTTRPERGYVPKYIPRTTGPPMPAIPLK